LASKSRCTSRPAKTPNARGFLRAAPHSCSRSFAVYSYYRCTHVSPRFFQRFSTSRPPVYRASHDQPCSP
jgi:hypothetical protein